MEFNEKLQQLRKQKGLTQEELAEILFVSRTAVSKWESGRGYPNIDSLKAISGFFKITIDDLLSGGELLAIAEEDSSRREDRFQSLVFGLLDCAAAMLFFLPFFGEKADGAVRAVSLLSLEGISLWLKWAYFAVVTLMVVCGILNLAFQNFRGAFPAKNRNLISPVLNTSGMLLFVISSQPYAAVLLFVFLAIKVLMLIKRR